MLETAAIKSPASLGQHFGNCVNVLPIRLTIIFNNYIYMYIYLYINIYRCIYICNS